MKIKNCLCLPQDSRSKNNIVESTAEEVKHLFTANGFSDVHIEEHDLATDDYSDDDAQGKMSIVTRTGVL